MSDRRLRLDLRVLGDLPLGGHKTVAGRRAFEVTAIGRVQSSLIDPSSAPEQGDEGAPDAWIVVDAIFGQRLGDLRAGDEILVLSAVLRR